MNVPVRISADIPIDNITIDVDGEKRGIHYFVLQIMEDDHQSYGLKITNTNGQSEETLGITHSYEEAEAWASKLALAQATPTSLHDLVDDWMS